MNWPDCYKALMPRPYFSDDAPNGLESRLYKLGFRQIFRHFDSDLLHVWIRSDNGRVVYLKTSQYEFQRSLIKLVRELEGKGEVIYVKSGQRIARRGT